MNASPEGAACVVAADRAALAEFAVCLVAYNVAADGRVVPRRTYRGFETFSFGQKKKPSPFATARMAVALRRLVDRGRRYRLVCRRGTGRARRRVDTSAAGCLIFAATGREGMLGARGQQEGDPCRQRRSLSRRPRRPRALWRRTHAG